MPIGSTSTSSPRTLAAWFRRRATHSADAPALSFNGRTLSYAEMEACHRRLADMLYSQGVRPGDRVGFLGFNCPEVLHTLFACAALDAIFIPLNFRLTATELKFLINDAGIHTVIAGPEHVTLLDPIRAELPCQRYISLGDTSPGWLTFNALLAEGSPAAPEIAVAADDVATIIYTSGTTGIPKGAMLTHANLWANNLNWNLAFGITDADILLTTAPMFHTSGLFVLLSSVLMVGGHVVLHRGFDAGAVIRSIEADRITMTFSVPQMVLFMSQHEAFETADLSSLRLVVVGGAPSPESLLRLCAKRGIPISHCYGLSESVAASTYLETRLATAKLNSSGRPMMLTQLRLIDAEGQEIVAPDTKGQICLRGENITVGYWGRPEATAEVLNADGWLQTGDIGYVDSDGFLYVCDRVKDMIISGGENVYPAEIENAVTAHPAVANAAVIGAPDPRWGEKVVAVVVLKPGMELSLDALQTFCRERLAAYKIPRELRVIDQLPLSGAGKVIKKMLREAASQPEGELK